MKRILFCLFWLIGVHGPAALAQNPGGGLEIASVSGTLDVIVGDKLKLKSEDGQEYIVVIGRDTTIKYRGIADANFLKPGFLVRFTAIFDVQSGAPAGALTELEIFRAVRQKRMSRDQQRSQTPGIYPVAAKSKKRNGGTQKKAQDKSSGGQNFKIVGQIRAIQGDKIQVAVGNRPIIVQLDPSATITVAAGDSMFCLQGDAVQVSGLRNAAQVNWIQAESIEITGENPLGADEGTETKRRKKSTRGKRVKTR